MTEKLYYLTDYISQFNAVCISCEKENDHFKVVLDKTAFFPEGGGQRSDIGKIGDADVFDVREDKGEIYHYSDLPLNEGEEYGCFIDWKLRFKRMQHHSGEHIVSGIVHSLYGYDNVGFHMDDTYVTVDFNGELTREQLDEIEDLANKAIYSNYNIKCYFPEESELSSLDYRSKLELTENVRLVEIENTDLCACCAPHVNKTGEIGIIKILDFMRHRGGVRIVMKSGSDALLDYRNKYKSVYDVSGLLSAKQDEISRAVERLLSEADSINRDFYSFRLSVANGEKSRMITKGDVIYGIVSGFDADMMRELANFGAENSPLSLVFSGSDEEGYSYIACSKSLDMKTLGRVLNESLSGRGGGRDTMLQGKCAASKETILNFINSFNIGDF